MKNTCLVTIIGLLFFLIPIDAVSQHSRFDMEGKALMVADDGFIFHLDFNTNSSSDKFVIFSNHQGDVPNVPHSDTLMVINENKRHRISGELDLTGIDIYDSLKMRSGLISSEGGFIFQTDYDNSSIIAPGYTFNVGSINFLTLGPFGTKNKGFTEIDGGCSINNNLTVNGTVSASCGVLSCSDFRYKRNISAIPNTLEKLKHIQGVYYHWDQHNFPEMGFTVTRQVGVIAQELEKEFPELVQTNIDGYKVVAYDKLGPILIEAIKEQQRIIEIQQEDLLNIKSELTAIKHLLQNQDNE